MDCLPLASRGCNVPLHCHEQLPVELVAGDAVALTFVQTTSLTQQQIFELLPDYARTHGLPTADQPLTNR